jgi:CubicO group peptidase (beta-lactamase class C family)
VRAEHESFPGKDKRTKFGAEWASYTNIICNLLNGINDRLDSAILEAIRSRVRHHEHAIIVTVPGYQLWACVGSRRPADSVSRATYSSIRRAEREKSAIYTRGPFAGLVSSSQDLVRWAKALFEGRVISRRYLDEMLNSIAQLRYSLKTHIATLTDAARCRMAR